MDTTCKNLFICPISHQIFKKPVLVEDGNIYEKSCIKKWFKNNNTSPLTNKIISKKIIKCYIFNSLLENYLKNNPDEIQNQYNNTKNYLDHIDKVHVLLIKNPNKLCSYSNFCLKTLDKYNKLYDVRKLNMDMYKYILDNLVIMDLGDKNEDILIRFLYKTTNEKFIYFLEKFRIETFLNMSYFSLIHYICMERDIDILKYVIGIGIDLNKKTKDNKRPIHISLQYGKYDLIIYLLSQNIDLDNTLVNGRDFFELVCLNNKITANEKSRIIKILFKKMLEFNGQVIYTP
ncbi:hypothetical protein QJ854_gp483 [Moumouvirus goulette]|uniref:U-box domain-containing protein n=1 Tax=Moumouvirus goulette TaxID=1247379 RepID=M1PBI9_9VIRU|nr:hypothetical protein QJ854_gp483 [Moumouvirus goulette]AGF85299.1 hypothetical protein glt_00490 [Moumouvirus goulette]